MVLLNRVLNLVLYLLHLLWSYKTVGNSLCYGALLIYLEEEDAVPTLLSVALQRQDNEKT